MPSAATSAIIRRTVSRRFKIAWHGIHYSITDERSAGLDTRKGPLRPNFFELTQPLIKLRKLYSLLNVGDFDYRGRIVELEVGMIGENICSAFEEFFGGFAVDGA